MAKRLYTTFQNMSKIFNGAWNVSNGIANTQPTPQPNDVVYKTEDPAEYQAKMLELQQNKYLQNRWIRSNQNLSMSAFAGLSNVKLMYRDADLMDSYPEIGAALDLTSEECVVTSGSRNGMVVNVSSKSDRIKSILEDLFVNRLNLQVTAQMVMRAMLKYGNQFMLLDIDKNLGVKGWRQLPVGEVERMENGIINPYGGQNSIAMATGSVDNVDMSTKFVWTNEMGGDMVPFRNWQIAHFRLLHNSMFLPYGCLVGDTRVETEFGYKEIKDIEIGDKVWTFNVDTQKRELADVTMHMNKGVKDVFEIRTLHNQIEGTSDHKLLCYENNSLVYKEIQDINIGDLLVIDNSNNKQEKKYDLVNRLENGFKTEKVRYKEYAGKKTTYDITVSNKNSNFFANGIVTHNCSMLLAARRHFRMLALMEDMMLIYRLERSMERRVYKIFVGALDDKDIPGYVEQIADQFKRTPIVDPLTGQLDLRKNILPVWKKTPIPLLDGRTITIEELAKEFDEGKTNYVYSIQDKTHKIVPGKVVWCGKNYTADQLYKITLDDDSYMVMAGEHEIIMRDGSKKRADEVVAGESVMPFYRKNENISYTKEAYYEQVYNPNSGKYEYTHKLIADSIKKNKPTNNTVHHKNFNKFDNRPCNLQWMDWFEHRDYHLSLNKDERIRKVRKISSSERWNKEGYREKAVRNMTIAFDEYVWNNINEAIKNGFIYSQKTAIDFVNNNLIEYLIEINRCNKIHKYKKITKPVFKQRIVDLGYNNFAEYLEKKFEEYHLGNPEDRMTEQRSQIAKKYNIITNLAEYRHKHTIKFDDEIWNNIRVKILNKSINSQKEIVDYINSNCLAHLNEINSISIASISDDTIYRRIKENGFKNAKEYIESVKKNHKIKCVEIIGGDDVYCMTVVGDKGEEDRHNFAIRTFNPLKASLEPINVSGCFVSNCASDDIFIPTRDMNMANPIETLAGAKNLDAIDDIKYIQKKVCAALRIPQSFLNFEEAQGEGKGLALMDVRFARTINRYQQAFLMELTKVATIHLYLLGFDDDLTNFTLTMNNPSTQAEQLELENLSKKISTVRDAVSDPGNGIPAMSLQRALKEIMKWSDKDIKENFEEIRLEKALAAEYEKTAQIIKRTGIFDTVDRIYGEPGAEYQEEQGGGPDGGPNGGPMGGSGGFGGGLDDFGAPGSDEGLEVGGEEGTEPVQDMGAEPAGGGEAPAPEEMPESKKIKKPLITEGKKSKIINIQNKRTNQIFNRLVENMESKEHEDEIPTRVDVYDKSLMISEEFHAMFNKLDDFKNETLDD